MTAHPSLTSEFDYPPEMHPQRTMEPYVQCWCLSGKKWKFCHKDRDKQPRSNIFEYSLDMRKSFNRGYCSHPLAGPTTCQRGIIRSHTVQRNGGLGDISDSKHHVISFKAGFEDIARNNGIIKPRPVGYKIASTFMGFCGHHDSEMFLPIETSKPSLNGELAFLLSFRAISYEVYQKEMAVSRIPAEKELDCGTPFETQAEIQVALNAYHFGEINGLAELKLRKIEYDSAYINKDYSRFCFYGLLFDRLLPIVSCGGFLPEVDFAGNQLQILSMAAPVYQHVNFNLTSINGQTVAVFGWTQDSPGPTMDFIRSLKELPDADKANAIAILAFEHIENTYVTPSWWDGLPQSSQEFIINKLQSGLGFGGTERNRHSLLPNQHTLLSAEIIQEFSSSNFPT